MKNSKPGFLKTHQAFFSMWISWEDFPSFLCKCAWKKLFSESLEP